MFNYSDYEFLKNDMKIVVDSIELKFEESPFKYFKSMAADTISKSIDIIRKERYNGGNNSKDAINSLYGNLIKSFKNNEVKEVFDTLRLSFYAIHLVVCKIYIYIRKMKTGILKWFLLKS